MLLVVGVVEENEFVIVGERLLISDTPSLGGGDTMDIRVGDTVTVGEANIKVVVVDEDKVELDDDEVMLASAFFKDLSISLCSDIVSFCFDINF